MTDTESRFTDGGAYQHFMGPWTHAVGAIFIDWLAIPPGGRWLDVGCGTGVFTETLLEKAAPAEVLAIDPAPAQIEHALGQPVAWRADFRVADAMNLPFGDASFDVVASALVLNFIPEREKALTEMRRVTKPGGCVAGYVWDFCGPLVVTRHVTNALRDINADLPPTPGIESSRLEALGQMFEAAGLTDVALRTIEVARTYQDFESYWLRFLENPSPASYFIMQMPEMARADLRAAVEKSLPAAEDGSVTFASRANAVKGLVVR